MASSRADETVENIDLGTLPENIGYVMRRVQMDIFQHFNAALAEYDIRTGQYSVLTVVGRNPGLKQRQIAAALGIKRPNFVTMLDELETRGLAIRKPSPTDRRSHAVFLTDKGEKLTRKLNDIVTRHENHWREKIGPDAYDQLMPTLRATLPAQADNAGGTPAI